MEPFDTVKYRAICREWASDEYALRGWLAAGEVLGNRLGWHFETDLNPTAMLGWCFGLDSARLVLTLEGDGYLLYDADTDTEHHLRGTEDLSVWLDAH